MSNPVYEKLLKCVESVRAKTDFVPKVALILGSGLGNYGDTLKVEAIVDYKEYFAEEIHSRRILIASDKGVEKALERRYEKSEPGMMRNIECMSIDEIAEKMEEMIGKNIPVPFAYSKNIPIRSITSCL